MNFPEYACDYAKKLAGKSRAFALQCRANWKAEAVKDEFGADPFGELSLAKKCFGLKQRFPDRVLVMASDKCFMNCRHCTRRGLLGKAEVVKTPAQLADAVEYVKSHPCVRDILISGGDPLTLKDSEVMRIIDAFAALDQVAVIRLCTRALAVNPARITPGLVKKLRLSRKVWVNTQFNSADEVTVEARAAASRLIDAGLPVSCQTVLLKGVNDTGPKMLKLLQALSAARIRPYYVFLCDPIAGIEHFRVSKEKARQIERYCAERIGGLALPKFVADIPGAKRKMPI